MARGCLCCLKYLMFLFNLIFWFFIVLLIIFFMELILIILFFVYKTEVAKYAREDLKDGLEFYGTDGNVGLTNAWNIIQTEYKCCGVDNSTDWDVIMGSNTVPDSCCQESSPSCGGGSPSNWFVPGCYNTIEALLEKQTAVIGSTVMSIVVIQILGMAFSMTLFHQISRSGKKYKA
ncbi:tetraspanin-9 isoform X4 [Scyliorhinus torazame]